MNFQVVLADGSIVTRFFFIIFSILMSVTPSYAEDFQYVLDETSLLRPSIIQNHELSRWFAQKGYASISTKSMVRAGWPVDNIFISQGWGSSFAIKAGLSAPAHLEGRIIEDVKRGLIAFHFRHEGTPYVLVSSRVSLREMKEIVGPWLKKGSDVSLWPALRSLLPKAHALGCDPAGIQSLQALSEARAAILPEAITQKISKCSADAWSGLKEATSGSIAGMKKFFDQLINSPQALWAQMKDSMEQFREFILNVRSELMQIYADFSGLPDSDKMQLACTVVGQLVAGGAIALAGGMALAKVFSQMILKLKKMARSLHQLHDIEKMGVHLPDKTNWAREVIRCAH